jgi:large subunit ribosomal protein L10
MNRDQKTAVVDEIAGQITAADAIFAVDYRGLSVSQAADLRAKLRDVDARFRIVKNSLTERAADQAGIEELKPMLVGPTALTLVHGDAALAAKALNDTARSLNLLEFKGGLLNGSLLSADDVRSIARLPSREVLQGQLVATIAAPLTGLVRGLNALIVGLAIQLKAIADMDPPALTAAPPTPTPAVAESAPAGPAPEAPAEPEAEAPVEAAAEPEAVDAVQPEAAAEPEAVAQPEPAEAVESPAEVAAQPEPEPADAVEPEAEAPDAPEVEPEPEPVVEPPVEPEVETPVEPEVEQEPEPIVEPPFEPVVEPPAGPEAEAPAESVAEVSESEAAPELAQQSEPDAASDAAPSE